MIYIFLIGLLFIIVAFVVFYKTSNENKYKTNINNTVKKSAKVEIKAAKNSKISNVVIGGSSSSIIVNGKVYDKKNQRIIDNDNIIDIQANDETIRINVTGSGSGNKVIGSSGKTIKSDSFAKANQDLNDIINGNFKPKGIVEQQGPMLVIKNNWDHKDKK